MSSFSAFVVAKAMCFTIFYGKGFISLQSCFSPNSCVEVEDFQTWHLTTACNSGDLCLIKVIFGEGSNEHRLSGFFRGVPLLVPP